MHLDEEGMHGVVLLHQHAAQQHGDVADAGHDGHHPHGAAQHAALQQVVAAGDAVALRHALVDVARQSAHEERVEVAAAKEMSLFLSLSSSCLFFFLLIFFFFIHTGL